MITDRFAAGAWARKIEENCPAGREKPRLQRGDVKRMDLHPAGSDSILEIRLDSLLFLIKSRAPAFCLPVQKGSEPLWELEITAEDMKGLKIYGEEKAFDRTHSDLSTFSVSAAPLFSEHTVYEIFIGSTDGRAVSLRHKQGGSEDRVTSMTGRKGEIKGVIDFTDDMERSELEVFHGGQKCLAVSVKVLPSDGTDRKAYQDMLEDISREACEEVLSSVPFAGQDPLSAARRLYSGWCFLKLMALLRKRVGLISSERKTPDVTVTLREGKRFGVRFLDPDTGKTVTLTCRREDPDIEAARWSPDAMITLERQERNLSCHTVFLIRYGGKNADPVFEGKAGLSEDDAGALCRYRDAALRKLLSSPRFLLEKTVSGAYLLYPSKSSKKEFGTPFLYRSAEADGTGALPFGPGVTQPVEELLEKLFSVSPEPDPERPALSRELEEELAKVDWSLQEVMAGTVRTEEQLRFNLEKKGYYAPVKFIPSGSLPVRYIALFEENSEGRSEIARYGEVTKTGKIKRGTIPVAMRPKADPDELYYYFTVKSWEPLQRPVAVSGGDPGRPRFTNRFLLKHCRESYQLFAVSSEEEYRLMTEIGKALENPEEPENAVLYPLDGTGALVLFEGCFVVVTYEGKVLKRIPMAEFRSAPRVGFEKVKQFFKS